MERSWIGSWSEQPKKLINGEAGLLDDGFERLTFEIPAVVSESDSEGRSIGMLQVVMTSGGVVDKEASSLKGAENFPRC